MVSKIAVVIFCLMAGVAEGQILRDINYRYLYTPDTEFSYQWKIIRQGDTYEVYYQLQLSDTTQLLSAYYIQWDLRASLGEKNGKVITPEPQLLAERPWKRVGKLSFTIDDPGQKLIVAKVMNATTKTGWMFHKIIPQKKSPYLSGDGVTMYSFLQKNKPATVAGFENQNPILISYFDDPFPAAAPAFSTSQAKVSKTIKPDSTFSIAPETQTRFDKKGLYLAQQDTASAEGLAFRVEEDYPKLGKLESLAGPLIYICTKQEYEKLSAAGIDKKKFDQVILSITGNAERARIFMRNYFKRVELANLYFTSYKEGWKTDRGMIYIIFGVPEEVYLFEDREVWEYKNDSAKTRFQFVKSATVYDPENYVLIRDKKYTDTWYQMIDLWRKARF